jgi:hypothetical protein
MNVKGKKETKKSLPLPCPKGKFVGNITRKRN